MQLRPGIPLVVSMLVAGLALGCAGSYDNPFSDLNLSQPPPAEAEIGFVSAASGRASDRRDLFAVDETGAPITRLTTCDRESRPCDVLEAAWSPDRSRLLVRRRVDDTNGDQRISTADGESLAFVDLARGTEAVIITADRRVSGADWSTLGNAVVYSALGVGDREDLFVMDPNGANNQNLTSTPSVDERRARIDPTGTVAVYERIEEGTKGRIFVYLNRNAQLQVTSGGEGTAALTGTPYIVGADADPDYSPDGRTIVFRRLMSAGNGGLGNWDVMTVRSDGTALATIATGPGYRGAPDWGPRGIVFHETDPTTGLNRIVTIAADGTRRTPVTAAPTAGLQFPRWLP
jgi:Tol biopolymer transport system component